MHHRLSFILISLIFFGRIGLSASLPVDISTVDVLSNGTRISATVYMPQVDDATLKLPAIAMAHGWGGEAAHLSRYATKQVHSLVILGLKSPVPAVITSVPVALPIMSDQPAVLMVLNIASPMAMFS